MYKNKRIVAIIPAKGSSSGIPKKNIALLAGKPLVTYSIEQALASKVIDRTIVSTEDREIAEVSKNCGALVIDRPKKLASCSSRIKPVLEHALDVLREGKEVFDLVVLLQPTSPLRKTSTIESAVELFFDNYNRFDSLVPVQRFKQKLGSIEKGEFKPEYELDCPRQKMKEGFAECGTVFIFKPDKIKSSNMFGKRIFPFIIENFVEAIDVDGYADLRLAEMFLKGRKSGQ